MSPTKYARPGEVAVAHVVPDAEAAALTDDALDMSVVDERRSAALSCVKVTT